MSHRSTKHKHTHTHNTTNNRRTRPQERRVCPRLPNAVLLEMVNATRDMLGMTADILPSDGGGSVWRQEEEAAAIKLIRRNLTDAIGAKVREEHRQGYPLLARTEPSGGASGSSGSSGGSGGSGISGSNGGVEAGPYEHLLMLTRGIASVAQRRDHRFVLHASGGYGMIVWLARVLFLM